MKHRHFGDGQQSIPKSPVKIKESSRPLKCTAAASAGPGRAPHLLNVPFDAQREVEQELEALQHVERVSGGVRLVLPTQHLLKQGVRRVARPCFKRKAANVDKSVLDCRDGMTGELARFSTC